MSNDIEWIIVEDDEPTRRAFVDALRGVDVPAEAIFPETCIDTWDSWERVVAQLERPANGGVDQAPVLILVLDLVLDALIGDNNRLASYKAKYSHLSEALLSRNMPENWSTIERNAWPALAVAHAAARSRFTRVVICVVSTALNRSIVAATLSDMYAAGRSLDCIEFSKSTASAEWLPMIAEVRRVLGMTRSDGVRSLVDVLGRISVALEHAGVFANGAPEVHEVSRRNIKLVAKMLLASRELFRRHLPEALGRAMLAAPGVVAMGSPMFQTQLASVVSQFDRDPPSEAVTAAEFNAWLPATYSFQALSKGCLPLSWLHLLFGSVEPIDTVLWRGAIDLVPSVRERTADNLFMKRLRFANLISAVGYLRMFGIVGCVDMRVSRVYIRLQWQLDHSSRQAQHSLVKLITELSLGKQRRVGNTAAAFAFFFACLDYPAGTNVTVENGGNMVVDVPLGSRYEPLGMVETP